MKIYAGDRTIDGIVVTVDEEPLNEHADIKIYSKNGFEWTYEGDESRQLAFAILIEHLDSENEALSLTEGFMTEVIANLDNTWEMTGADVESALQVLRAN